MTYRSSSSGRSVSGSRWASRKTRLPLVIAASMAATEMGRSMSKLSSIPGKAETPLMGIIGMVSFLTVSTFISIA